MDSQRIEQIVKDYSFPNYRIKQLYQAFFENYLDNFDLITPLPQKSRNLLKQKENILSVDLVELKKSKDQLTYKALLKLEDNLKIETVLMSPKPNHWTACISSQVGCAMQCSFCATGKMGLIRNLNSEEITDQVLFWKQFIQKNKNINYLNNVVYMGMGEPLHNTKEVFLSLQELMNPNTFKIGARHISISTSGFPKEMIMMANQFPQVNLALSLHAVRDELRTSLMPINKKSPLSKLRETLDTYIEITNRKVFLEYILMKGENDSSEDAHGVVRFVNSLQKPYLVWVNLIVYNQTDAYHQQSSKQQAVLFRDILKQKSVGVSIRKNLGRDIDGACGQLLVKRELTLKQ